ncbi:hypothetical protein TNCV_4651691 [Trichonephila clavipes]|nr:hypothetical protein TNCV_4651691 [Trichonephila clavipes]
MGSKNNNHRRMEENRCRYYKKRIKPIPRRLKVVMDTKRYPTKSSRPHKNQRSEVDIKISLNRTVPGIQGCKTGNPYPSDTLGQIRSYVHKDKAFLAPEEAGHRYLGLPLFPRIRAAKEALCHDIMIEPILLFLQIL